MRTEPPYPHRRFRSGALGILVTMVGSENRNRPTNASPVGSGREDFVLVGYASGLATAFVSPAGTEFVTPNAVRGR